MASVLEVTLEGSLHSLHSLTSAKDSIDTEIISATTMQSSMSSFHMIESYTVVSGCEIVPIEEYDKAIGDFYNSLNKTEIN
jgi:hypothetical protein